MNARAAFTLLRLPHMWARFLLMRDVTPFLRLQFLYAAMESGLLQALTTPASKDELIQKLQVQRPELLDAVLRLGVFLKELACAKGRYRLRGKRALALIADDSDPLFAVIQEVIAYHGSVYRHLAARLRGAELGNYLDEYGVLIARSSRVLEPFVGNFVRAVLRKDGPVRMLEVGCGSGTYLRSAVEANAQVTGVAIDMDQRVVKQASANLAGWGISNSFRVILADIRRPPPTIAGSFDLITLYNNIYYFTLEERPALFRRLLSWLAPHGALALVSMMRGGGLVALDLDLGLRSTLGCTALPQMDELTTQLRECGFRHVKKVKLLPGEPFYGMVAMR